MLNKIILLTLGFAIGTQSHALKFQQPKSKEIQFKIKGQQRRALVFNSAGSKGQKRPAVLVLHGGGGTAEKTIKQTKFDELSVQKGFIAVFAQGTRFRRGMHAWNTGYILRKQVQKADDIAYFDRLIDTIVKEHGADPQRIYMSGASNGAMMSFIYAQNRAKKLAAIAPMVGAMFNFDKKPEAPLPILMVVGAKDEEVPIAGGYSKSLIVRRNQEAPFKSHEETTRFWVQVNNSGNRPEQTREGSVVTSTYPSRRNGAPTISIVDYQGGHGWPGYKATPPWATPPSQSFDAAAIAWDFFQNHSRSGVSQNPSPNVQPKAGNQPKPRNGNQNPRPNVHLKPDNQPKLGMESQPPVVVINRDQLETIRESMFGGSNGNPSNSKPSRPSTPIGEPIKPFGEPGIQPGSPPQSGIHEPGQSCRAGQYDDIPTQTGTYKNLWVCSTKGRNKTLKRTYTLVIPKRNPRGNMALLLALHGGGGSPKSMAAKTGFHEYGEEFGFVTVYPAGYAKKWNSGHAGIKAHEEEINDVSFIEDLIDILITHLNLDRNRVFIAGHSNGAMMAHRLGAELSTKITAIAPVAGATGGSLKIDGVKIDYHIPRASEKISIFAIHGKCDTSVTYDGSKGPTTNKKRTDLPTLEGIEFWAQTNSCGNPYLSNFNKDKKLPLVTYSYGCGRNKNQKTTVKLLTIRDGSHGWPTGEAGQDGNHRLRNVKKLKKAIKWGQERGCSLADMSSPSQRVDATKLIINEFFKNRN